MIISMIVALDDSNLIGKDQLLPWHLPSDLRRFRRLTMGHNLLLGRKTYETIRRILPGRHMIILSRQKEYLVSSCTIVTSISQAFYISQDRGEKELFVIGGGEIYRQCLPYAQRIYFTHVHTALVGNVYFPQLKKFEWRTVGVECGYCLREDEYPYTFSVQERIELLATK